MSEIELFHVDAFTAAPFAGNPAAVCLLPEPAGPGWMQRLAAEMNLSETAFVTPRPDGDFGLRWFTPTMEVVLCGHATLASAHVLWEAGWLDAERPARFHTREDELVCRRSDGGAIEMDFPAVSVEPTTLPAAAIEALGVAPVATLATTGRGEGNALVEVADEAAVHGARPDVRRLRFAPFGIILTAPGAGGGVDFVSRYFAPSYGVDEDPVTGSTHCALGPYWGERLGKDELVGFQASRRGGRVGVRLEGGGRVTLVGEACTIFRATLHAAACPPAAAQTTA